MMPTVGQDMDRLPLPRTVVITGARQQLRDNQRGPPQRWQKYFAADKSRFGRDRTNLCKVAVTRPGLDLRMAEEME
jgi:hypothetical protein